MFSFFRRKPKSDPPTDYVAEIIEALSDYVSAQPQSCRDAASILRRLGDKSMVSFLREFFDPEDPSTWEAGYALAHFGDKSVLPFLTSYQPPWGLGESGAWRTRAIAAELLGKLRGPEAGIALEPFLNDPASWQVRLAAMRAL
jgi:HEAT repeat protein